MASRTLSHADEYFGSSTLPVQDGICRKVGLGKGSHNSAHDPREDADVPCVSPGEREVLDSRPGESEDSDLRPSENLLAVVPSDIELIFKGVLDGSETRSPSIVERICFAMRMKEEA